MKVLAVMGSPRKGLTNQVVGMFEQHLKSFGEIHFQYVYLKDLNLQGCKGCALCLEKGEEYCPLKDGRQFIFDEMMKADGIIFATPNYSLQVSGLMKTFLDRFSFVFHRPCFFHKASIAIVTQGVYGGNDIIKYLNNVAEFWGFNSSAGLSVTTPWGTTNPNTEWPIDAFQKIDLATLKAAEGFYNKIFAEAPKPSLKRVLVYRLLRSVHKYGTLRGRDYVYFEEKGWFDKPYFYETRLSLPKKFLGGMVDMWQMKQANKH